MNKLESLNLLPTTLSQTLSGCSLLFLIRVKPHRKVKWDCAIDGKQLFSKSFDQNTIITKSTLYSHLNREQAFDSFQ